MDIARWAAKRSDARSCGPRSLPTPSGEWRRSSQVAKAFYPGYPRVAPDHGVAISTRSLRRSSIASSRDSAPTRRRVRRLVHRHAAKTGSGDGRPPRPTSMSARPDVSVPDERTSPRPTTTAHSHPSAARPTLVPMEESMFNPIVTNVLASDRSRRLRHAADTRRLIKSTTAAAATLAAIVSDDRSRRTTTLGARREAVVPKRRPLRLLGRKTGTDVSGIAAQSNRDARVLTGP